MSKKKKEPFECPVHNCGNPGTGPNPTRLKRWVRGADLEGEMCPVAGCLKKLAPRDFDEVIKALKLLGVNLTLSPDR
jgi:hypothetical protein